MTIRVNGVEVSAESQRSPSFLVAVELLRQRAAEIGLIDGARRDQPEETLRWATEELLVREVIIPAPGEEECRRHYDNHPKEFQSGELVHARHILFQVTPAIHVPHIRALAEETLNTLITEPGRFDAMARDLSNCPSGQQGGNLGQLGRGETVPEFEKVLFRPGPTGILREVVRTRFGFHLVAIDRRIAGKKLPFELVREKIAERLSATVQENAIRQYVSVLAARAEIEGIDFAAAETPLVQ